MWCIGGQHQEALALLRTEIPRATNTIYMCASLYVACLPREHGLLRILCCKFKLEFKNGQFCKEKENKKVEVEGFDNIDSSQGTFFISCFRIKDLVSCVSLCAGVIQFFGLKSQIPVGVHVLSIVFETLKH